MQALLLPGRAGRNDDAHAAAKLLETGDKIIIDPLYAPSISCWAALVPARETVVEAKAYYQKGSFRNRCHIYGANGLLRLSIPLEHGKQQRRRMDEVRISYDHPWQRLHWDSLCAAYRSSPFFEFYEEGLIPFYKEQVTYLMDFNMALNEHLSGILGVDRPAKRTTEYREAYNGAADLRDAFHPKRQQTKVEMTPYRQVFSPKLGFLPDLSIFDLLFHQGPAAAEYLRNAVHIEWTRSS